jgi:putative transposase
MPMHLPNPKIEPRRFHETLAYKKPMDVYQESIKLNQEKAKAS